MPTAKDINSLIANDKDYDIVVLGAQEATFSVKEEQDPPAAAAATTVNAQQPSKRDSATKPKPSSRKSSASSRKSSAAMIPLKAISKLASTVNSNIRSATATEDLNRGRHPSADHNHAYHGDTKALLGLLSARLPGHDAVVCYQRGEMRLLVFVRRPLSPSVADVEVSAENTGLGHVLANKGGIVARLTLGETSLCFVSCHLQAHEGRDNYVRRCHDLKEIFSGAKVGAHKR